MPTEPKIQILVADDQEIVRLGVKALLADTEIGVVAEAATGQAAAKLALVTNVDLVLMGVRMPYGDATCRSPFAVPASSLPSSSPLHRGRTTSPRYCFKTMK